MISLNNVSKSFGARSLFSGVTFRIDEKEKIALIGANGTGKTTLLSMIEGSAPPDEGEISRSKLTTASIMAQELRSDETALDAALSVFGPLFEMEAELERLTALLCGEAIDQDKLITRQHALHEAYEDAGGLTCRARARSSLLALGLTEAEIVLPLQLLSGGQQAKVRLARALLSAPGLLLLDEPTNHLDLQAIEWLEGFLQASPSALLVVSHDRAFLERVTNRTLELEEGKVFDYPVSYTAHIERRAQRRESERRIYVNTMKEIERLEGIVEQQRRWNRERNIRMAESKMKMIERLEANLSRPANDPETMRLSFPVEVESGDDVIMAECLSKSFGEKHLFSNLGLHMRKAERLCIVGGNGTGKTTLLRILTGALTPDSGVVRLGTNVRIGVYEQGQSSLDPGNTALQEVHASCPSLTLTAVRNAMAAFLFRGDDVFKPVSVLSGGEKARVALLKLMFSGANFLILDEPTNHLDAASREVLEGALLNYPGTILAISHDRYFIDRIAQSVGLLASEGLRMYPSLDSVPRERPSAGISKKRGGEYAEAKLRSSEFRKLTNRNEKSQTAIASLEAEIAALEKELSDSGSDYERALSLCAAIDEKKLALENAYTLWLETHDAIENNYN